MSAGIIRLKSPVVPYRGRVYTPVVSNVSGTYQLYVQSWNRDGSGFASEGLGGETYYAPAAATDKDRTFLAVFVHGTNNETFVRTKRGTGGWDPYVSLGGIATDTPVAYGGAGFVRVTVTGDDGRRYSRASADGLTWSNWAENEGKEIPLGTNLTTRDYVSATMKQQDINFMKPGVMRMRMSISNASGIRVGHSDLNQYRDGGVRTMVMNTAELIPPVS